MRWAQITDTGLIRPVNEDSLCVSPGIGLFAVADGMGGHQAGEIASSMALGCLEGELARKLSIKEPPAKALLEAVEGANRRIYEIARQNQQLRGMGTTITACLHKDRHLFVAHVGDSRAYLLRDGVIRQLTEDHSLVRELVKNGGITEEQALSHPQRNVLTRALGTEHTVQIDLYQTDVSSGDLLLLCTDGLTCYLRQDEILAAVKAAPDPDAALRELLSRALSSGGADNITMILVEF